MTNLHHEVIYIYDMTMIININLQALSLIINVHRETVYIIILIRVLKGQFVFHVSLLGVKVIFR